MVGVLSQWRTMAVLKVIFTLVSLGTHAHGLAVRAAGDVQVSLAPQSSGGFNVIVDRGEEREILGHIGRTLPSVDTSITEFGEGVTAQIGAATLTVTASYEEAADAYGIRISWDAGPLQKLQDCFDFSTKHWYGGPMQLEQKIPIETSDLENWPYVSKEYDNGAIVERYWLNSAGEYFYVHPQVPLFVDYHHASVNHICFTAQVQAPYSSRRNHTELTYDIWFLSNPKTAHQHAVSKYLGRPSGVPDYRMVQHPIWSTWAQYARDIDENKVLEFANEINARGFLNSQLEIDDLWETCYGSLEVDENKFPNFTRLVQDVKDLGFRVTLWIHPFINNNCEPYYSEALTRGYLVLNEEGSPGTTWWNNNGSTPGYVDFTNPEAASWWAARVQNLANLYGIDSFKFDAGESSFSPQIPVQNGDIDLHPHHIVEDYVRTLTQFGDMIEFRAGSRTQDLPNFVRMVDRDSIWGLNNGLPTIVTTAIQMNLNGYTFVLPDMIGGNGFNLDHDTAALPGKELFIRWVQANTFLPAMQYSFAPWDFDHETSEISRRYTELHSAYAGDIYAAMMASVETGEPVNAPLWWADPYDEEALRIWDEFLLGDRILVAPVFEEGAVTRHIYLPAGVWYAEGDEEQAYEGPVWLTDYPAPLDTLPYFIREGVSDNATAPAKFATVLMLLGVIMNIIF